MLIIFPIGQAQSAASDEQHDGQAQQHDGRDAFAAFFLLSTAGAAGIFRFGLFRNGVLSVAFQLRAILFLFRAQILLLCQFVALSLFLRLLPKFTYLPLSYHENGGEVQCASHFATNLKKERNRLLSAPWENLPVAADYSSSAGAAADSAACSSSARSN